MIKKIYSIIIVSFAAGSSFLLDLDTFAQVIKPEANSNSTSNMSTTAPPASNLPTEKIYLISGFGFDKNNRKTKKISGNFTIKNTNKIKLDKSDIIDFNLSVYHENTVIKCGLKELKEFTSDSSDDYRRKPDDDGIFSPVDILLQCGNDSMFSLNGKTLDATYKRTTKSVESSQSTDTRAGIPRINFNYSHNTVTIIDRINIHRLNIERQPGVKLISK